MKKEVPGSTEIRPLLQGSPILYLRRVMTAFLQGVYANIDGEYQWSEDANNTRINIVSSVPIDGKIYGQRPCIAITRSGLQFTSSAIGGFDEVETSTGAYVKSDLINSVFILHHISTKEAEAEDLGFFTAEMIWAHTPFLAGYYISIMGAISVEAPGDAGRLVEGDVKGLVTVPVTVPFRIARNTRVEPLDSPVMKAMSVRMNVLANQTTNYPRRRVFEPKYRDPAEVRRGPRMLLVGPSQVQESMRSSVRVTEDKP